MMTDERRAEIEAEERERHNARQQIRHAESDRRWQDIGKALPIIGLCIAAYYAAKWAGLY